MDEPNNATVYYGRRGFLRLMLMAGAAAGAAGAAGWFISRDGEVPTVVVSERALPEPPSPPELKAAVSQGFSADYATQNENARLAADLEAALSRLEVVQRELEASKGKVSSLATQLDESQGRVGVLEGLAALYAELEAIDLDELVEASLEAIPSLFENILAQVPLLEAGLDAASTALDNLELSLPSIQDGVSWLSGLVDELGEAFGELEEVLAEAVDSMGSFMETLGAFFAKVLKWVPFGAGDTIERGLRALGKVMSGLPGFTRSIGPMLFLPLGRWFSDPGDGVEIKTSLIDPIRGEALAPAGRLASDASLTGGQLVAAVAPLHGKLDQRRPVRQEIARYKDRFGLA